MTGFSADWLSLREPFDAAARAASLVEELHRHLPRGTAETPLEIVDLGAGAGSNLRYLAPRLGGAQRWRLVDDDARLLEAAVTGARTWATGRGAVASTLTDELVIRAADWQCGIRCERRDLAMPRTAPLDDLEVPSGGLVTAAALLDLVSPRWLEALATRCEDARAAVCFALSYDGRTICTPTEPEDALVLELFNRHQHLDKGFGPALGPTAARSAEALFAAHGYRMATQRSDWAIESRHAALQQALLDGWLGAATELAPERQATLTAWHRRRSAHVAAGRSTLRVGHVDLVGWL